MKSNVFIFIIVMNVPQVHVILLLCARTQSEVFHVPVQLERYEINWDARKLANVSQTLSVRILHSVKTGNVSTSVRDLVERWHLFFIHYFIICSQELY